MQSPLAGRLVGAPPGSCGQRAPWVLGAVSLLTSLPDWLDTGFYPFPETSAPSDPSPPTFWDFLLSGEGRVAFIQFPPITEMSRPVPTSCEGIST